MRPVYGDKCFWVDEENARWAEIRIRYGGAISRSSVAWTAVSIVLCGFASGIQKLVDRWTNV